MPEPVVRCPAGAVRGEWRGPSAAFRGIPVARPPVGALRFEAPAPAEAWDGVRPAVQPGPTPQRRTLVDDTTIPEPSIPGTATLNVDVFTPSPGAQAKLPVMVWIHGGGFIAGSPASPWYDGRSFNAHGVVTVTVSYRLGFDGFGHLDGAPANRGLLDVVHALEWVRANIESFGGDPAQVTVAGQSAGGGIVLALLAMPRAQGLFRAAIAASAVPSLTSAAQHAADGRTMAALAGVAPTRAGWLEVPEERILDLQRQLTEQASADAPAHFLAPGLERCLRAGRVDLPFGPAEDGVLLPGIDDPAWTSSPVPLLLGVTADEFVTPRLASDPDSFRTWLADAGASADLLDDAAAHDPVDQTGRMAAELLFRRPAAGLASTRGAWLYDFRSVSPVTGTAGHCHDLPYAFDLLDAEKVEQALGPQPSATLAAALHSAWLAVITGSSPPWTGAQLLDDAGLAGDVVLPVGPGVGYPGR